MNNEHNKLWNIFEETGDVEDYLDYVHNGEYYVNMDAMLRDGNEIGTLE